ncbi:MAG: HAMP domain-containing histidine kinase, partial [Acidobacteriia bacterium]|nr:HAMP domain-containing histidine kinase [Terriglobia bacterium]
MLAQVGTLSEKAADPATHGIKLERDVLLQHLLEANLSLQEYEQDRTGFLAQTAHEFRAPLVGISGYCGLLSDLQLGPLNPEQLNALEKMQRSAKRLTRLANAMLQISMGRELEFEPTMQLGDIQELIQQAIGEVRPVADSKRLKLLTNVTPPPEPLLFESSQIEQVLVNLLDNACRLTPCGGSIDVKAFPTFWDRRSAHVTEVPAGKEQRSTNIQRPNAYLVEVHNTGSRLGNGAPG